MYKQIDWRYNDSINNFILLTFIKKKILFIYFISDYYVSPS